MGIKISRIIPFAIIAVFILTAGVIFAVVRDYQSSQNISLADIEIEEEPEPEEYIPSRAELIMTALVQAYPKKIEKAEFRNDDWAVLMSGTWYYYAGGAMLPEELLEKAENYTGSFGLTSYLRELPPWTEPSPEQAERYRQRYNPGNSNANSSNSNTNSGGDRNAVQRQRTYHFRDSLWRAGSREESSRRVVTIDFLGKRLPIHSDLSGVISLVEERIIAAAKIDSAVQSWITNIGEVHGWNWRNVANSQSRSNHSYGIAIDILPKSLNGKETYWQWAAQNGKEWWNVPYEERYHPPDAVIKAFEAYGFMWGGKWSLYDTMHFEYRPEVFILSGIELTQY